MQNSIPKNPPRVCGGLPPGAAPRENSLLGAGWGLGGWGVGGGGWRAGELGAWGLGG